VTLREAQRHHRMVWMLLNPFRQSGGRADAADGVLVDLSLMGYVNHRRRRRVSHDVYDRIYIGY
jgi:hypothetical protein